MIVLPFAESTPLFILFLLFVLLVALLLFYRLYFLSRVAFGKPDSTISENLKTVPVSVIICARNEDHTLPVNLPLIMDQDHPEFEVVVVNDCSSDNTQDILREFEKKYERLKVVTIKEDRNHHHGKKFAVMVGIKAAKYDQLLFTDADCRPVDRNWMRKMTSAFADGRDVITGVGLYEKKSGILNLLIRYDAFLIAWLCQSMARAGLPYMGVGRNLAYRRSLFFANKGFSTHYHLESGDDDLFINAVATKNNTAAEFSPESITISVPKDSIVAWVKQKRRHLTTWPLYRTGHKFILGLYAVAQYLMVVSFFVLLAFGLAGMTGNDQLLILVGIFGFNLITYLAMVYAAARKLKQPDLFLFSLAGESFLKLFYPLIWITGKFASRTKWQRV